jgi:molecular chaperone DnaK (HSP70)
VEKKTIQSLKSLLKRRDLSPDEREALQQAIQGPLGNNITEIKLDLTAFKRARPSADKIRLCLDFGTAMSKAWATGRGPTETLPLLIGNVAGGEGLTVPSSIYISDNGRIHLGSDAERQHRAETLSGRPRFDNLKRMLSEAEVDRRDRPTMIPVREYLLVVDAGAGTTDFALFQAITRIGETRPSYALLRKSVRMSRIARNEVDLILRPIVLEACGIDQQELSVDDFANASLDLDSQIREIKRNLFDQKSISVELRPTFSGRVDLAQLLSAPKMMQDGSELIRMRNDILACVFEHDQLDVLGAAGSVPVYVLLTGGSGGLPIIRELAAGDVLLQGARFRFVLVDQRPDWIDLLPREAARQLADVYPQCAVAIGGSVPTLPVELRDMEFPVTPARPGKRTLPRTQITGV